MASWILVPSLQSLRAEFDAAAPDRDRASDGAIGDPRHAASSSDHNPDETGRTPASDADNDNEVHAVDVDADLRKPGLTMTRCVEIIVTRHREGRDDRLQNVIYNRRIWSRSWGWTAKAYTGANAHTQHAHFGARYTTEQERDTSPWGLLEEDDVTKNEFTAWMTEWAESAAGKKALAVAVLTYDPGKDAAGKVKPGGIENVGTNADANPTVGAAFALRQATVAPIVGYQIRDRVDKVLEKLGVSAGEMAALRADIAGLPDDVVTELADAGRSPQELADALRAVLGDRAPEVGRILQGS